jgi:hypothetical protein
MLEFLEGGTKAVAEHVRLPHLRPAGSLEQQTGSAGADVGFQHLREIHAKVNFARAVLRF